MNTTGTFLNPLRTRKLVDRCRSQLGELRRRICLISASLFAHVLGIDLWVLPEGVVGTFREQGW
jgi:hypothetical protein